MLFRVKIKKPKNELLSDVSRHIISPKQASQKGFFKAKFKRLTLSLRSKHQQYYGLHRKKGLSKLGEFGDYIRLQKQAPYDYKRFFILKGFGD